MLFFKIPKIINTKPITVTAGATTIRRELKISGLKPVGSCEPPPLINIKPIAITATATAIVINVPKEVSTTSNSFVDEKVIFYYDSASRRIMLNSTTTTGASATITTSNPVELVKNVQTASFGYSNNVVTIYMRIQTDRNNANRFREIRDSAVTRINFDN